MDESVKSSVGATLLYAERFALVRNGSLLLGYGFTRPSDLGWKVSQLRQPIFHWQDSFRIIEVHLWFERKIPQSAEANVNQSECGMIDADVTTAFCAIPAVADFAALE